VSVRTSGVPADGQSWRNSISADGRFVAFESWASNLVPGDTNQTADVFVHDRRTGATTRVSVDSNGTEGNLDSYLGRTPSISSDGRYVVMSSDASNLVPGDTNGVMDVFLHDRQTGSTTRISAGPAGAEATLRSWEPALSADGNRIVFASLDAGLATVTAAVAPTIYLHDRTSGRNSLVCLATNGAQADGYSLHPAISADGRCVAFRSQATNFFPGDSPQVFSQIYVRDLAAGVTTRVSVDSRGVPARPARDHTTFLHTDDPSLSADGRFVGFSSEAGNLVAGDNNSAFDVFLHDRSTGTTTRVSTHPSGGSANGPSSGMRISADARFLAFSSAASDLVPGDTSPGYEAFVHDRLTGTTTRVSVRSDGRQGAGTPPNIAVAAFVDSISEDGRFVTFGSEYSNLVPGDTNATTDIFVHDRASPVPGTYGSAKVDSSGCLPAMSSAGLPSVAGTAAFDVGASPVQSGRTGMLLYALAPNLQRFRGGVLSISPPLRRAAVLATSGNASAHDCTGALAFDFNLRIRSGLDPDLVPGTVAYAQYLYRDPGDPSGFGTGMSDALRFVILP